MLGYKTRPCKSVCMCPDILEAPERRKTLKHLSTYLLQCLRHELPVGTPSAANLQLVVPIMCFVSLHADMRHCGLDKNADLIKATFFWQQKQNLM